jgi:hypothetical protein
MYIPCLHKDLRSFMATLVATDRKTDGNPGKKEDGPAGGVGEVLSEKTVSGHS